MFKLIVVFVLISVSFSAFAQNYNLKRVVLSWEDGRIDDSAIGPFRAIGSMSIEGNRIVQNLTFCSNSDQSSCEVLAENSGGTIIDVQPNAVRVSIQLDSDQTVGDLTILALSPNIITMFVYEDGTAETHEWEPIK